MKKTRLGIGIHDAIPSSVYHADPCRSPSLSSSIANILLTRSPLHAWYAHPRLNKNFEERSNGRFDLGTAAHAVCLENAIDRVEKLSFDSFRTNAAKEARDATKKAGRIPILEEQYDQLTAMQAAFNNAVLECADVKPVFAPMNGKPEQTLIWREKEGRKSFWNRGRLDWLSNDHSLIVDYKTVENAEPEAFIRGPLVNHGYDVQAAFYLRGLKALNPAATETKYVWVLQEIEAPFAVSFVGYGQQMAEVAEQKVAQAIKIWKRCLTTKQWSAYGNKVAWANLPSYAVTRWEEWQAMQGFITSSEQLS